MTFEQLEKIKENRFFHLITQIKSSIGKLLKIREIKYMNYLIKNNFQTFDLSTYLS